MPQGSHPRILTALVVGLLAVTPAGAALSTYLHPDQLAERASWVVEGTVVRTGSGYDPMRGDLATYTTLRVEEVHRGPRGLDEVVIREPGGAFGDVVHEIDAVPVYRVGERVLVYLEAASDGALRTSGWFFGKFVVTDPVTREAVRDLGGHGRIVDRPQTRRERHDRLALLEAVDASSGASGAGPNPRAVPGEFRRLQWSRVEKADTPARVSRFRTRLPFNDKTGDDDGSGEAPVAEQASFVSLAADAPTRWSTIDSGGTVRFYLDPTGNPLGNSSEAIEQVATAMTAWNAVPESRVQLGLNSSSYAYTVYQSGSPARVYNGINTILFDDPYDDIPNPVGCAGVLAIGGYWRSQNVTSQANGVDFHEAMQGYVITNDAFECFLGSPENLAEVLTHELGHVIGFGHSTAWDAIMRASTYGGRGARLGDDDRDAAHCHYPHTLHVLAPNGGEEWSSGETRNVRWSTTSEPGGEPGTVDVELSLDGGSNWVGVADDEPNDGLLGWTVPSVPVASARLRVVRRLRTGLPPAGYGEFCSGDESDGSFSILAAAAPVAGSVAADPLGGLQLERAAGGALRMTWAGSCSGDADDYAVYSGSLDELRMRYWNPTPLTCDAGIDLEETVLPRAGDRYFLIVPLAGEIQGRFADTDAQRPDPAVTCGQIEQDSCP